MGLQPWASVRGPGAARDQVALAPSHLGDLLVASYPAAVLGTPTLQAGSPAWGSQPGPSSTARGWGQDEHARGALGLREPLSPPGRACGCPWEVVRGPALSSAGVGGGARQTGPFSELCPCSIPWGCGRCDPTPRAGAAVGGPSSQLRHSCSGGTRPAAAACWAHFLSPTSISGCLRGSGCSAHCGGPGSTPGISPSQHCPSCHPSPSLAGTQLLAGVSVGRSIGGLCPGGQEEPLLPACRCAG